MAPEQERAAPYGYCPICGSKGVARERRPNGNDRCEAGHVYPATEARAARTAEPAPDFSDPTRRACAEHIVSLACAWPDAVDRGEALDAAAESALWKAAYFGAFAATITPAPPVMPTQTVWQVMQEIDQSILRSAAQDVVDRWDTPLWKEAVHTGDYIEALRMALALNPVVPASVEPTAKLMPAEPTVPMLDAAFALFELSPPPGYPNGNAARVAIYRAMFAAAPVVPPVQAGADAADAKRYRWLRDIGDATWIALGKRPGVNFTYEIDAAIDRALRAAAPGGQS